MFLFKKKKDSLTPPVKTDQKKEKSLTIKKGAPSVSSVPGISKQESKKVTPISKSKAVHLGSNKDLFGNLLLRPIITEKATILAGENNCYVFEIASRANKISIKKAIAEVYNFTPIKINIVKIKGKSVRYGRSRGRTKNKKRALVFLKKGDHIEFVKRG